MAISPLEQIEREVVVVPELVSNSLIISATPRFFEEIRAIVEQLDARPPMVGIQVLIAEVTLNNTDEFGIELGLQDSILFDRSLLDAIQTISRTTTFGDPPTTVQEDVIVSATNTPGFNFNTFAPLGNAGSAAGNQSWFRRGRARAFELRARSSEQRAGVRRPRPFGEQRKRELPVASVERKPPNRRARTSQVTTLENQPAYVQVGQRVPYITSVTPIVRRRRAKQRRL